ncbi:hypothetical protein [Dickeya poaceiphila]|uniref:hypothetical protein n=1 Tax=Dickeya poaceiphila TaxID=568768 RepID=UPI0005B307D4|nr:hypothetical protein [Dickeya poaceiphila]
MFNPVGGGVRVKGFDAESFETVPQLAGVLGGGAVMKTGCWPIWWWMKWLAIHHLTRVKKWI